MALNCREKFIKLHLGGDFLTGPNQKVQVRVKTLHLSPLSLFCRDFAILKHFFGGTSKKTPCRKLRCHTGAFLALEISSSLFLPHFLFWFFCKMWMWTIAKFQCMPACLWFWSVASFPDWKCLFADFANICALLRIMVPFLEWNFEAFFQMFFNVLLYGSFLFLDIKSSFYWFVSTVIVW